MFLFAVALVLSLSLSVRLTTKGNYLLGIQDRLNFGSRRKADLTVHFCMCVGGRKVERMN